MLVGVIYALPNLYGEDPAVQVAVKSVELQTDLQDTVERALIDAGFNDYTPEATEDQLLLRFTDQETQLKAADELKRVLGNEYTVALNLAPATPAWLRKLGATANVFRVGLARRCTFSVASGYGHGDATKNGWLSQRHAPLYAR